MCTQVDCVWTAILRDTNLNAWTPAEGSPVVTQEYISHIGVPCVRVLTLGLPLARWDSSVPSSPRSIKGAGREPALPCPESADSQQEPSSPLRSDSCTWQVQSLQREQIQHLPRERDFPGLAAGRLEPRKDSDPPGSTQQSLGRGKTRIQSFLKG